MASHSKINSLRRKKGFKLQSLLSYKRYRRLRIRQGRFPMPYVPFKIY